MDLIIKKKNVKALLETDYVNVYDLQYKKGAHYFDVSRKKAEDLAAIKSNEELKSSFPDAVSIFPILKTKDGYKLFLLYEYRYPAGRTLLSPPAGLIDKEDLLSEDPLFTAAKRELFEETGLTVTEKDSFIKVNPYLFSTPGMSDESNSMVSFVLKHKDFNEIGFQNAEGSECFTGYELLSKKEVKKLLKQGCDKNGIYYSIYTYAAMMYFVSDLWKKEKKNK